MTTLRRRGIYAPPLLGTMGLWVRADSGLTFNGATVAGATDYSGQNRTVAQGTAGAQLDYTSNGPNGRPWLLGNGTKRLIATLTQAQPYTMFAVVYTTSDATSNQYITDGTTGNSAVLQRGSMQTTARLTVYAGTTLISAQASVQAAARMLTPTVVGGVFNGASGVSSVNGVETTGAVGATGIATTLSIGANAGGAGGIIGGIAELVLFQGALDATARARLVTYLKYAHIIS